MPTAPPDPLPETASVPLETVKASLQETDASPSSSANPHNLKEAARLVRQSERPSVIAFPWQAWLSLAVLFVIFISIGATYFWAVYQDISSSWLAPAMTVLWLLAGSGVLALFYWMWS